MTKSEGFKRNICVDCNRKRPLDELIRKYAPRYTPYHICIDCLSDSQEGTFYQSLFPLGTHSTIQQKNRLKSLLKWVLGY